MSGIEETRTSCTFTKTLDELNLLPLSAKRIETLQANLGYRCNLACKHCHVEAGPHRTEMMSHKHVRAVIHVLADSPITILDLTGGAPELHPDFRYLVTAARSMGCHVMARSNLAVLFEPGQAYLPGFYRDNEVEVIASLPYFRASNVDAVRGDGIFRKCINALQLLNDQGYGHGDGLLKINLVHNPRGPFLPPSQESLEREYRDELWKNFGVRFNQLFTLANMPLGRFKDFLVKAGSYEGYLDKLQNAFKQATLDGIMCRQLISVGWDGRLADCDFNLVAGYGIDDGCPDNILDFDYEALCRRKIALSEHCFGCTAGQGFT